jgi:hypothetical protein
VISQRSANDPTYPPPPPKGLAPVLERNIEALQQRRMREERAASWEERVADAITRFTGSMLFVDIRLVAFGLIFVGSQAFPSELLNKKQHGEKIEVAKERKPANVVNLMAALRQSIGRERSKR